MSSNKGSCNLCSLSLSYRGTWRILPDPAASDRQTKLDLRAKIGNEGEVKCLWDEIIPLVEMVLRYVQPIASSFSDGVV